jgi:hypothetical protein
MVRFMLCLRGDCLVYWRDDATKGTWEFREGVVVVFFVVVMVDKKNRLVFLQADNEDDDEEENHNIVILHTRYTRVSTDRGCFNETYGCVLLSSTCTFGMFAFEEGFSSNVYDHTIGPNRGLL